MKTYPIAVSETGLHVMVDDVLSPTDVLDLMNQLRDGLFEWCKLTGKKIDGGKPK